LPSRQAGAQGVGQLLDRARRRVPDRLCPHEHGAGAALGAAPPRRRTAATPHHRGRVGLAHRVGPASARTGPPVGRGGSLILRKQHGSPHSPETILATPYGKAAPRPPGGMPGGIPAPRLAPPRSLAPPPDAR